MLIQDLISSPRLRGERKVWIQPTSSSSRKQCCIFLDAEIYINAVGAVQIVDDLSRGGLIPPTTFAYLSFGEAEDRHFDFTCNPNFSMFLDKELRPWIEDRQGNHEKVFLCGLSLSGLAAAHAVLMGATGFDSAVCQSPSAWWNNEWLATNLQSAKDTRSKIWLSVGKLEVDENVTHPPSNLYQGSSQLDSSRRLAGHLKDMGQSICFVELDGGHDAPTWAADLPHALSWLLNNFV